MPLARFEVTSRPGRTAVGAPYPRSVLSVRRPSDADVERYVGARVGVEPTARPAPSPPPGFRSERFSQRIGRGDADFERAADGIRAWVAHSGSGVDVLPAELPLEVGATVGIRTRQLGLWVVAACRVAEVVDEPDRYGFVYATLPDHPECGYESFYIRRDGDDEVIFDIEAVSKPGIWLVRLGSPVTRELQRRATEAYLAALESYVRGRASSGAPPS